MGRILPLSPIHEYPMRRARIPPTFAARYAGNMDQPKFRGNANGFGFSILSALELALYSALRIFHPFPLGPALTAWSPWERRLCFALPFCMRAFLCCLRSSGIGGGDPAAMTHDAVSAVGGAIGAMHVPEKWMPGRVDLILNSHNIMHLLVVSAVYCMHHATVRDLLWMASPSPCASRASQVAASLTKAAAEHLTAGAGEAIGHAASEL
ncbi:hypothetical protein J437_LFUL009534 [Ladona fulva]|uniref:Progestin and adipoQ receptor family member 4 n=1 Tax=Ladona fulva TaxID=123851 RepID=A0A8K0K5Y4_LADFU|nr:hypothetical protein J437_LFUL009534 [Ladona fulva]